MRTTRPGRNGWRLLLVALTLACMLSATAKTRGQDGNAAAPGPDAPQRKLQAVDIPLPEAQGSNEPAKLDPEELRRLELQRKLDSAMESAKRMSDNPRRDTMPARRQAEEEYFEQRRDEAERKWTVIVVIVVVVGALFILGLLGNIASAAGRSRGTAVSQALPEELNFGDDSSSPESNDRDDDHPHIKT